MRNKVTIIGEIKENGFSHMCHGKKIYMAKLSYIRPSGVEDTFKVFYEDPVKPPASKFVQIDGDMREMAGTRKSETVIHAFSMFSTMDCAFVNEVEIEGVIARNGTVHYSKNVPYLQTVLRCDRDNGKASDYVRLTIFGQDAFEVYDSGKGKLVYAYGRIQESVDGVQITTRGIEWK